MPLSLLLNKYVLAALVVLGLAGYIGFLHWELARLKTVQAQTVAVAKAEAAQARADTIASNAISERINSDYENRLSALNARIEQLRHAGPGNLPAIPAPTLGLNGPADVPPGDGFDCAAEYAREVTKLIELQEWVREQETVQPPSQ